MINNHKHFAAAMVALAIGFSAGSVAVGAAVESIAGGGGSQQLTIGSIIQETSVEDGVDFSQGPVQCAILADMNNGVMTLESVVHAQMPVTGSYVLMIASMNGQNRSRIQQGGNFAADLDQAAILNKVRLGNRGATYDVSLKLSVNGQFLECAEKFAA